MGLKLNDIKPLKNVFDIDKFLYSKAMSKRMKVYNKMEYQICCQLNKKWMWDTDCNIVPIDPESMSFEVRYVGSRYITMDMYYLMKFKKNIPIDRTTHIYNCPEYHRLTEKYGDVIRVDFHKKGVSSPTPTISQDFKGIEVKTVIQCSENHHESSFKNKLYKYVPVENYTYNTETGKQRKGWIHNEKCERFVFCTHDKMLFIRSEELRNMVHQNTYQVSNQLTSSAKATNKGRFYDNSCNILVPVADLYNANGTMSLDYLEGFTF